MSRNLSALALAALLCLAAAPAQADLPPPPGKNRVGYSFQVDAEIEGSTLVAFPISSSPDPNGVHVLEKGKSLTPFQGWTPGIFLLSTADAAAIPKADHDSAKAYLDSHAKQCLKQVPRVFDIESTTNVQKMDDVIHVAAKGSACEASLAKTIYTTTDGKTADGGADASGRRTAPAPIGKGLPSVSEAGFVGTAGPSSANAVDPSPSASPAPSTSSSAAPPPSAKPGVDPPASHGCAGCTLAEPVSHGAGAALAAGALALALIRRRRTQR